MLTFVTSYSPFLGSGEFGLAPLVCGATSTIMIATYSGAMKLVRVSGIPDSSIDAIDADAVACSACALLAGGAPEVEPSEVSRVTLSVGAAVAVGTACFAAQGRH